jgi:hypothetical protein
MFSVNEVGQDHVEQPEQSHVIAIFEHLDVSSTRPSGKR